MCNKTKIIGFGFYYIRNNQGLGEYMPWLITLNLTLIFPDITKTSCNNNLLFIILWGEPKLLKLQKDLVLGPAQNDL